jgi:acetyl-CoA acetyltransferase
MSGNQKLVVAGGVETMSSVPLMSSTTVEVENGLGDPWEAVGFRRRYPDEVSQFELDAFASQTSDGAAAVMVASGAAVDRLGLVPPAKIRTWWSSVPNRSRC